MKEAHGAPADDHQAGPIEYSTRRQRGGQVERWLAICWRTAHIGAVVALGAAVMDAPLPLGAAALAVLLSGGFLLAHDLWAGRVALGELAGTVVVLKLLVIAAAAWKPEHARALFWGLLVMSSLSAHAPRRWRHWAPGRR
jgi:F0F1-type ATP synthase assembly protein I